MGVLRPLVPDPAGEGAHDSIAKPALEGLAVGQLVQMGAGLVGLQGPLAGADVAAELARN